MKVGQELNLELASKANPFAGFAANVFGLGNTPANDILLEIEIIVGHSVNDSLQSFCPAVGAIETINSRLALNRRSQPKNLERLFSDLPAPRAFLGS